MVEQLKSQGKKIPVIHTIGLGISSNAHLDSIAAIGNGESRYVTPQAYLKKYGNSPFPPSKEPRFETSGAIPIVPKDEYPIKFELK
jgi:hypothetical protein